MKKHLKRYLAPKFWKIPRKAYPFAPKPRGPHPKFECIPLLIVVRDVLKLASSGKEAKAIIKARNVFVDAKIRTDPKYSVGLFDVISIPKIKKNYRVVLSKHGLSLIEIPEEEARLKLFRVEDKTWLKGKRLQLNLSSGWNILVEKNNFSTFDSILMDLVEKKMLMHIKFKEGSLAYVMKGKHAGKIVKIKKIFEAKFKQPSMVLAELDGKEIKFMKANSFVVGEERPVIKL